MPILINITSAYRVMGLLAKPLNKLIVMVTLQMILIAASFSVIIYSEIQESNTGSLINVAGKNRLLASSVQLEMTRALFHESAEHPHVMVALDALEENIRVLRDGGMVGETQIAPLPAKYSSNWILINDAFSDYKMYVLEILSFKMDLTYENVEKIAVSNHNLVNVSDSLADLLGRDSSATSIQAVYVKITLGALNAIVLVVMVMFAWRVFKKHNEDAIRAEKFETIGKFASMMAHDMRNPLGTLRNSIELIQRSEMPASLDKEITRSIRSIKRMSHQIEGVLNYARTVPLAMTTAHVMDILHASIDAICVPKNITVDLSDRENEIAVQCDPEKLEFVFSNVILNAIQAIGTDTGMIRVRVTNGSSDHVLIEFENTGSAIPPDDLSRIFDPLFTTKMQGTGLGLTSCKNIVDMHHGTIRALSRDGLVVFAIRLPKIYQNGDSVIKATDIKKGN